MAATAASASVPALASVAGAAGGGGADSLHGEFKSEKLQVVGLAVPVAQAVSGAAAGGGVGISLLTAQEALWMQHLPSGIGKPFVGRTFTRRVVRMEAFKSCDLHTPLRLRSPRCARVAASAA